MEAYSRFDSLDGNDTWLRWLSAPSTDVSDGTFATIEKPWVWSDRSATGGWPVPCLSTFARGYTTSMNRWFRTMLFTVQLNFLLHRLLMPTMNQKSVAVSP